MKLFHFSEEPTIQRFEPHVPQPQPEASPLVWAIDEAHAPNYFFPRDCPRVCFWSGPRTTRADRERYFGPSTAATSSPSNSRGSSGFGERGSTSTRCLPTHSS